MKEGLLFVVVAIALNISGCATPFNPINIPDYQQTIRVYPSKGHVSTLTETPAADNLVENSQVFLAGKDVTGNYLGLLGVMIDRKRNAQDIDNPSETLNVKFDALLASVISKQYLANSQNRMFDVTMDKDATDIIMLPSVRLVVDGSQLAQATYRLTVRFIDHSTNNKVTKDYFFCDEASIPLSGNESWASDNAKVLIQHATVAFHELVGVVAKDLSGQYASALDGTNNKHIYINFPNSNEPVKAIMVEEYDGRFLVSCLFRGKVIRTSMTTVPQDFVKSKQKKDMISTHISSQKTEKKTSTDKNSIQARLETLKELYEKELITKDEYDKERQELLDEL